MPPLNQVRLTSASAEGEKVHASSFLTGSRVYGLPNPDSDIDLVILVSLDDMKLLAEFAEYDESMDAKYWYECTSISMRFGKLNVICCTDKHNFDLWKTGTERLKKNAPVSRDFAVRFMEVLRGERFVGD
jgi:predicted nucleotidyltransferase